MIGGYKRLIVGDEDTEKQMINFKYDRLFIEGHLR